MENDVLDLGSKSREILSWMVLSELLKIVSEDCFIGVLHPGDGQYDCLSLISPRLSAFLYLNREGTSCLAGGQVISNIWSRAAISPRECCLFIVSEAEMAVEYPEDISSDRQIMVDTSIKIASLLNEKYSSNLKAIWGWSDSPYESQPCNLLTEFDIPEEWKDVSGPSETISWQGWLFCITQDNEPYICVNMRTGKSIDCKGKNWDQWPQFVVDSFGEKAAPLGYRFEIEWPTTDKMILECVHPSMKRKTNYLYTLEEGCQVHITPVFVMDDKKEAEAMWGMVDNTIKFREQFKDILN